MKARKLLLINLILLFCILPLACKKLSNYSPTVVVGRVTNLATGKGIPNALMVLKAHGNGFSLPKKANIELETRTDELGNYRFEFEAYASVLNGRKTAEYSVQYFTEGKRGTSFAGQDGGSPIDLSKYYNDDLVTWDNPTNLGGFNVVNINVVLAGRVFFQFFNDKPGASVNDTLFIRNQNQFLEYRLFEIGGGNTENEFLKDYPFVFITGENTIHYDIRKNGVRTLIDTTFFVEPKDYYINFHY
jgi:hypothetical protein